MGSYDLTCFVTKQHIGCGDKVYFIPLKKVRYSEYGTGNFFMMEVTGLYKPATLPILGTYDDYGTIEVEKDDHTAFLEKQFNKSIEEICDMESGLFDSGCYVHYDAYHALQEHLESWNGKPTDANYFEEDFNRWVKDTDKKVSFHKKMLAMCDPLDPDDFNQKIIKESKEALETFNFGFEMGNVFGFCDTRDFEYFVMYKKAIYYNKLSVDSFIAFFNFMKNLYSISTPLAPVLGGEQHGNHYMAKRLLEVSQSILDKKLNKE